MEQERKNEDNALCRSTLLTPGQCIRPLVTRETAAALVQKLYGMKSTSITELNAYDDRNYHVICDRIHTNPFVTSIESHGYVLKVVNSLDSQKIKVIEAQTEMLLFLNERGFKCPLPVRNLNGTFFSTENLSTGENTKNVVRLLVYRPGELLHRVPLTTRLLENVGRFTAKLDRALLDFHHPGYDNHKTVWMLDSVPSLRQFTYAVKNDMDRDLAHAVIDVFEKDVLSVMSQLEECIVHGDLNEQNIVMTPNGEDIEAVIDMGDSQKSCLLFEFAIVLCYMILQAGDVTMGRHVVEGYQTVRKLTPLEKKILKVTVCARICQSLVMGAHSHLHDPQNEYVLSTQKSGWKLLKKLWPMDQREVFRSWGLENS